YRKRIRDQFIIEQMRLKNVASEILISPYKIETYYETNQSEFKLPAQVKLRMIELDKNRHGGEATVELGREILTKLKEGVPFDEMARIYSDGPQKDQGGDRDWLDRQYLRKELAEVAFQLKAGQLSDVINTPDTVYLLQIEQTRPAHVRPLSEVRADIERTLTAAEKNRLTEKWINRLKEKSYIAYF
ncbi:MAG: peptidyl-prolyl cis-trans isomerase, partial [Verrucomicrobia bacterium]|nr:peptidyl-prolyl cis-trans isomerase [Verrucomicrobiota bacterium]